MSERPKHDTRTQQAIDDAHLLGQETRWERAMRDAQAGLPSPRPPRAGPSIHPLSKHVDRQVALDGLRAVEDEIAPPPNPSPLEGPEPTEDPEPESPSITGWDPREESAWRKACDREEPRLRGALDAEEMCVVWRRHRSPRTPEAPSLHGSARSQLVGLKAIANYIEEPFLVVEASYGEQVAVEVEITEGFWDVREALWSIAGATSLVRREDAKDVGEFLDRLDARWPSGFLPDPPSPAISRSEHIRRVQEDVECLQRGGRRGRPKGRG